MQILTLNKSVKNCVDMVKMKMPLFVAELDKSFDFINESSRVTFNLATFNCVEMEVLGSAEASLSHPTMTQSTMYCAVKSINRWRCGCFYKKVIGLCLVVILWSKVTNIFVYFGKNTKLLQRSVLNFMQKL